MVKHAILLADKEWCEAASSGRVKVYHFIKPRKLRIRTLSKDSTCVVMTKARAGQPQVVYGEFTVTDVREVDASEYDSLARNGLIHNPQRLRPNEKRWIISFDEFREYSVKLRKDELTDVKTSTSKKPISEWVITGLSYIDDQALEAIRRRAGGFIRREEQQPQQPPTTRIDKLEERVSRLEKLLGISELTFSITHECTEFMLLRIGRQLGFKTYTADSSKACGNTRLGDLANTSRDDLSKYVGPKLLDPLSAIDVVWHREGVEFYLFEVVIQTDMHKALVRLSSVGALNAKMFIVSNEDRKSKYESSIRLPTFNTIRNKCTFISVEELARMFVLTNLWRQSIEPLQLP
jgi:hypothetical protein